MLNSIRQFFTGNAFRKEMAAVIILKVAALFLLWGLFFSHHEKIYFPQAMNERINSPSP